MSTSLRMNQFYKTKTCPWYFKGKCERGEMCRFAHNDTEKRNLPDLSRTSFCPSFMKRGVCQDRQCRFAHHVDQLRATDDMYKTSLCFMFMKSRCDAGNACRHAHGTRELRAAPPRDTDKSPDEETTGPMHPPRGLKRRGLRRQKGSSHASSQSDAQDCTDVPAENCLAERELSRLYSNILSEAGLKELLAHPDLSSVSPPPEDAYDSLAHMRRCDSCPGNPAESLGKDAVQARRCSDFGLPSRRQSVPLNRRNSELSRVESFATTRMDSSQFGLPFDPGAYLQIAGLPRNPFVQPSKESNILDNQHVLPGDEAGSTRQPCQYFGLPFVYQQQPGVLVSPSGSPVVLHDASHDAGGPSPLSLSLEKILAACAQPGQPTTLVKPLLYNQPCLVSPLIPGAYATQLSTPSDTHSPTPMFPLLVPQADSKKGAAASLSFPLFQSTGSPEQSPFFFPADADPLLTPPLNPTNALLSNLYPQPLRLALQQLQPLMGNLGVPKSEAVSRTSTNCSPNRSNSSPPIDVPAQSISGGSWSAGTRLGDAKDDSMSAKIDAAAINRIDETGRNPIKSNAKMEEMQAYCDCFESQGDPAARDLLGGKPSEHLARLAHQPKCENLFLDEQLDHRGGSSGFTSIATTTTTTPTAGVFRNSCSSPKGLLGERLSFNAASPQQSIWLEGEAAHLATDSPYFVQSFRRRSECSGRTLAEFDVLDWTASVETDRLNFL